MAELFQRYMRAGNRPSLDGLEDRAKRFYVLDDGQVFEDATDHLGHIERLYLFIRDHIGDCHKAPTIREMMRFFNTSMGSVRNDIDVLIDAGLVLKRKGLARGLICRKNNA